MGARYSFRCEACGHSAEVSGGKDAGMIAEVETMTCADCQELVDVLTATAPMDSAFGRERPLLKERRLRCPECHGRRVTPWPESRPCPKCGGRMEPGDLVMLWD